LGFMSDILKGTPTGQSSVVNMYQGPGSIMGQLGGLGLGAYGLSSLMKAEGGSVSSYAKGGKVEKFADQGSVGGYGQQQNVNQTGQPIPDLSGMDKQQLLAAKQLAMSRGDQAEVQAIDEELAIQASLSNGLGHAFNQLPQQTQQTYTAAGGGIVAFADRGAVKDEPTAEEIEAAKKPFIGYPMAARPSGKQYGESNFFKGLGEFLIPSKYAVDKPTVTSPAYADSDTVERADRMTSTATPTPAETKPSAPTHGGISEALKVMADTHGVSKDTLMDQYNAMYDKLSAENKPLLERMAKAMEKSAGRADQAKAEALPKALAEFGFQWAAAAAKPGARTIQSAATASPTLAASAAESQKAIQKAEDLQTQLEMENAKFQLAMQKGDRATAMQHATNVRQLQMAQQQLQLHAQQIAQQGAYQQGMLGLHGEELGIKKDLAKIRGIQAAGSLYQGQARIGDVARKAGLDFDNSMQARKLMKELTEQYGPDKAKYMYGQQRRAYVQENTQGIRDQVAQDNRVQNVYDLLGE
jgi:hypothetical protein